MSTKPTVLFVCVHNAGRSQMAAGYLNHLSGGAIEVRSAGSEPRQDQPGRHSSHGRGRHRHHRGKPKILTPEAVKASDVVITMGCGDACPTTPASATKTGLDDPAGQGIDVVRPIRNQIRGRVEQLIQELVGESMRATRPRRARAHGDRSY